MIRFSFVFYAFIFKDLIFYFWKLEKSICIVLSVLSKCFWNIYFSCDKIKSPSAIQQLRRRGCPRRPRSWWPCPGWGRGWAGPVGGRPAAAGGCSHPGTRGTRDCQPQWAPAFLCRDCFIHITVVLYISVWLKNWQTRPFIRISLSKGKPME